MLQKGITRRHKAKMPMVAACVFFIGLLLGGGGRGGVPFLIGLQHSYWRSPFLLPLRVSNRVVVQRHTTINTAVVVVVCVIPLPSCLAAACFLKARYCYHYTKHCGSSFSLISIDISEGWLSRIVLIYYHWCLYMCSRFNWFQLFCRLSLMVCF